MRRKSEYELPSRKIGIATRSMNRNACFSTCDPVGWIARSVIVGFVVASSAGCGQSEHATIAAETDRAQQNAASDMPTKSPQADTAPEHPFPRRIPAPSLEGGEEWLNTSAPL